MKKDKLLKTIKILLKKYIDKNSEIKLESNFIEEILFIQNEDGTKSINNDIFYILRENKVDMAGVSFNNVHIKNYNFKGFKNIEINLDKIPNKDLSKATLEGVKLKGTLDGASLNQTNFNGYIGNLYLNPQTIQNKDLSFCKLDGIIIDGSFDDVLISSADFRGAKGNIIIDPQRVAKKSIAFTNLQGVTLVGNYNEQDGSYLNPCFDHCYLVGANFIGSKGQIEINPQKVKYKTMALCKGENIVFTDTFEGVNIEKTEFINCSYQRPKILLLEQKFRHKRIV